MTDAPHIEKKRKLHIKTGPRVRTPGWVGRMDDGSIGYSTDRHSEHHRIKVLDAYAISNDVLSKLRRTGVDTILIVETDTRDVLEYPRAMFHGPHSDDVPDEFSQHKDDPQRFVGTQHATRWPNHADRVYLPRGADR